MDNGAIVRHLFELISGGDIDGFAGLLADDFVEHEVAPGLEPTKAGVVRFFRGIRAAFPDMRMEPEDLIQSGDKVVARVRFTGTNDGAFMGMPATGRQVDVQLVDIFRMGEDGRCHEHWGVMDSLGMMQQLGAVPAGAPA